MGSDLDRRDEAKLPIVTRWLDLTVWLLKATERMPRHWRHSLVHRIDGESLEVLTLLTEASYRRRKADLLREANVRLSRLRILLELARNVEAMSPGAHEHAMTAIDECGRMLGGWIRDSDEREAR